MRGAAAVLAALLAGGAAQARFAPRLDAPYRLTRVQEHDDGRGPRRFTSERRVTFARAPGGFVARLTLVDVDDSVTGSDYATLAAALAGAATEVELDRTGHLRAVRDLDAIWARLRTAIGASARDDAMRLALWRLHDAATTTQRVQVVAGGLLAVLGPDDADRRAGTRAVTLPARGAAPLSPAVTGQERVRIAGPLVTVETVADGEGAILSRRRIVDRRTGLVVEQHDDQRATALVAGAPRTVGHRTTIMLSDAVS